MRFMLQMPAADLILLASSAVTFFLGEFVDSGVIMGVVLINALVGLHPGGAGRERARRAGASVASDATVHRSGTRQRLNARALVPGDLCGWLPEIACPPT